MEASSPKREDVFFRSKLFIKFAWPMLLIFQALFSGNLYLWNLEFIVLLG